MNTRDQVITYIDEQISENTTGAITATKLNAVLDYIVDRWFEDSEIKVTATGLTATNLKAALEELLSESTMTGSEIKAALEGITGAENYLLSEFIGYANAWLGTTQIKSALDQTIPKALWDWSDKYWPAGYRVIYDNKIYKKLNGDDEGGGSFDTPDGSDDWIEVSQVINALTPTEIVTALETLDIENCLVGSKVKYTDTVSMNNIVGRLDTRQNMNYDPEWSYGLGNVVVSSGVIYRSLQASNTGNAVTDTDWWETVGVAMTAAEIAAALNANSTFVEMLKANRVQIEGTEFTVKLKFDSLDALIAAKQKTLHNHRDIFDDSNDLAYYILNTGEFDILQMAINRVPYQGVKATSFSGGAGSYDFRYEWESVTGTTRIYLNPATSISFVDGDIIDIIYY